MKTTSNPFLWSRCLCLRGFSLSWCLQSIYFNIPGLRIDYVLCVQHMLSLLAFYSIFRILEGPGVISCRIVFFIRFSSSGSSQFSLRFFFIPQHISDYIFEWAIAGVIHKRVLFRFQLVPLHIHLQFFTTSFQNSLLPLLVWFAISLVYFNWEDFSFRFERSSFVFLASWKM